MMSETIRCPMCGAPNPEELEECQTCGARLKPLRLRPQEEEAEPQGAEASPPADASPLGWTGGDEEEDLPSWLRELAGEEMVEGDEEPESLAEELAEEPDLLGRLGGLRAEEAPTDLAAEPLESEAPSPEPPSDQPDWLSDGGEAESIAGPGPADEATLDWLRGLEEEAPTEPTPAMEETPAPAGETLPDWLSDLEEESPAEPAPAMGEGEAPTSAEETLPDWLSGLEEETPAEPAPTVEETPSPAEETLPDWLSDLEEESPAEPVPAMGEGEAPTSAEETLPDWLSGLEEETPAAPAPAAEPPTEPSSGEPQDTGLDWLAEIEGEEPTSALPSVSPFDLSAPAEEGTAGETLPAIPEEPGAEGAALPAVPGSPEEEFALDELPDWLDTLAPEALAGLEEEEPPAAAEGAETLAPGALPDWLEAIRPEDAALEAALPLTVEEEEVPEVAETKGPLAGLSGVLPAEAIPRPRKTGAAASRLLLSEEDARYAEVLQAVVAEESQVTAPSRRWRWLPQRVLRITIALVLLVVAWLPSVFGGLVPPLPEGIPPEVMATNRLISALPAQPPVLLAVDYNPAWRAEMEAAAEPVVDHLMVRGARLAVLSTQPMGPALAEHFIHGPLGSHGYREGEQYVNLGYLSGGMAALQHLAASPMAAAPWSIQGYAAWETPPLAGVHRLSDFALVMVITDDPDIARAWVEQVQPHLGDTPLVMVVSAQAEPLVRPYYESQPPQVQGMVTGLMGGLAYMRLTGRLGEGVQYWGGFTWGIWAAILLLVLGGLYNLFLGWRARRQAHG